MSKKVLLLILLLFISTIQAQESELSIEVSPLTLNAGESRELLIKLKNIGEETFENAIVKIVSNDPSLTIIGSSDLPVGNINPDETKTLRIPVYVDENAGDKGVQLQISVSYKKKWVGDRVYNTTAGIKISGKKPLIRINVKPIEMEVGREKDMEITLTNVGNGVAKNVKCSLSSDHISLISPSLKLIGSLSPRERAPLTYTITSKVSGVHKLQIVVSYGDNLTESTSIDCRVVGKPELALTGMEFNPNGTIYEIIGTIANVGTDKALYVSLSITGGVSPSKDYYVGTLEPNDFTTFELHTSAIRPVIRISYRDSFGNQMEEKTEVEIEREIPETPEDQGGLPIAKLFVVIMVAIIIYSWTKGRKR